MRGVAFYMEKNTNSFGINTQLDGSPLSIGVSSLILGSMSNTFLNGNINIVYGCFAMGIVSLIMYVNNIGNHWDKLFTACGLSTKSNDITKVPKLQQKTKTNNGYMLRFNVVEGISLTDMENKKETIENYIGKKINITYNNKNFFIEIFEKTLQTTYNFTIPKTNELKGVSFPIGYSLDGIEWLELSEDNPHLLIAGMSGSGKSVFLRSVLTSIILLADKYETKAKLHLVDFKYGAEFSVFRKCKCISSFSKTKNECVIMLKEINEKINKRYELFFKNDVVNIAEYNKIHKYNKMEYELVIIDEFASLIDKKDKEPLEILINISQKARACGIFMIVATQRPDANVLDGKIKANFANIVGLKCINEINSRIIWDKKGLEDLHGKGHCMFRKGDGEEIELQGMFLTAEQAKKLIEHTYIQDKKTTSKGKPITPEEIKKLKNKPIQNDSEDFSFLEEIKNEKRY